MRFSTPVAILALCLALPQQISAQETEQLTLSGIWMIDPAQSQTARQRMREGLMQQMEARGTDPRRTNRMAERWKSILEQDKARLPQAPFARLEISHQGDLVQIAYKSGRARDLFADGRPLEAEEEYGIESATASWEGSRLVVETQTLRGAVTEFWELSEDGIRLLMTTEHAPNERLVEGLSYQRVYTRSLEAGADSSASEDEEAETEPSEQG